MDANIIFSLDVFKIVNNTLPNLFLYFILQTDLYRSRVEGFATGTTVLRIKEDVFSKMSIRLPQENALIESFNKKLTPLFKKIELLENINLYIYALRESLLPHILSDKI